MGMTTFSGPVRSLAGFIGGADSFTPVAALPKTLTAADNGKTQVVSAATGIFTLPLATADMVGTTFNFRFTVNSAAVIMTTTTTPGDKFLGGVYNAASGGAATLFVPNGTTNDVINLGTTKGGQAGSTLSITCTAVNIWTVSGDLIASATPITPFADS